jgi:hypothetical protein
MPARIAWNPDVPPELKNRGQLGPLESLDDGAGRVTFNFQHGQITVTSAKPEDQEDLVIQAIVGGLEDGEAAGDEA